MKYLVLIVSVLALSVSVGLFIPADDVEADPIYYWNYVCYHNNMPYFLVVGPFGGEAPECPDDPSLWNSTWDNQDNIDCQGKEGTGICTRERHIDCEFDVEPGNV